MAQFCAAATAPPGRLACSIIPPPLTAMSISNRNRTMTGLKFLFRVTLRRLDLVNEIYHLREPQRLPKVMSPDEAKCLLLILTPTFRGSLQSSDQKKLLFAKLA